MVEGQARWVISGGIGSGKSAVRRLLDEQGFFTVDADSVGHEVLVRGGPAFRQVAARWPEVIDDGEIDRSELAGIVFSDVKALRELEEITHPHIFGMIRQRVQGIPDPIAVEIPLIEHRMGDGWRRLIVDCSDDVRLERLKGRGVEPQDAANRISSQPSRSEWLASGDAVVPNHDDQATLRSAVDIFVTALA